MYFVYRRHRDFLASLFSINCVRIRNLTANITAFGASVFYESLEIVLPLVARS
jgi:hypothetical protein